MTARRLVENCVLTNQTAVVDEMLNKHLLPEEYIYPFVGDVMEWWLIDSWLAERLKREGEVIIEEYGPSTNHWPIGRVTSGVKTACIAVPALLMHLVPICTALPTAADIPNMFPPILCIPPLCWLKSPKLPTQKAKLSQ